MATRVMLQDGFLNQIRKMNAETTIFLTTGIRLKGFVKGFDSFTILLDSGDKQQLLFKHAISTIIAPRKIKNMFEDEEESPVSSD